MASFTRSMAYAQALKPVSRQSTLLQPSRFTAFSLRRQTPISKATRIAAFQTSARKSALLPPPPQKIDGTVNDPVVVPHPHPMHGSYHWDFERALSVGLVPLTVAPFIGGSLTPVLDAVFCATLLLHSHIGFQACIVDYFPKYRVPKFHSLCQWLLRFATVLTGFGLYQFETNDVGLTAAVAKIWKS